MIALDLNHGERFRLIEGNKVQPDIHECIVTGRPKSWQMYPGVVARNMRTGHYIGLGPAYSVKLVPPRTERQTPGLDTDYIPEPDDDYNDWEKQSGCREWSGTRYDEQCANCHQIKDICNRCDQCEECHG